MTISSSSLKKALCTCILSAASIPQVQADENLWLYARGVDTRPKDTWELKLKNTSRLDKGSGDYTFNDFRPEVEYGITDRLTVGAALFIFDHHYSVNDPDLEPMFGSQGGAGGDFDNMQFGGFELGLKYNILSAYKDAFGLSVGFNYERREVYRLDGADIDQDSFVPILYVQKNFLDNTLITAFTGKMELERRESPGVLEEEIALDLAVGVAYRFAPKWFVGFEGRYQSDFLNPQINGKFDPDYDRSSFDLTDIRWGSQYQYGTYIGPSLHYAEQNWWVTGSVLLQVKGGGSEGRNPNIENGKNYDEHERVHIGVTVGFNF